MNEEFLYYIWQYRLFDFRNLKTVAGEPLSILVPGQRNTDAGPDFFNAKVKIGATTWAGNVEMHVSASDWNRHGHQKDAAYDNVVLHVVFNNDAPAANSKGEQAPALDISRYMDMSIYSRFIQFMKSRTWIPCQSQMRAVDEFTVRNWLDRLAAGRLERKSDDIRRVLELTKNNWAEAFYICLARSFGFKMNAEPFEQLARSLPSAVLGKHKDNPMQIEAMLFGQAGLLNKDFEDEYPRQLQKEYAFLRKKFGLKPMEGHLWKFLRLRPSNFPTIRISQLANLVYRSSSLFSKVLAIESASRLLELFRVSSSAYWETHYTFGKTTPKRARRLGSGSVNIILINTVAPFLFTYGLQKGNAMHRDKALALLEEIDGEKNSIIAKWKELGLPVRTAYETQALLELKNEYCARKRCLHCGIGSRLLNS